VANRPRNNYFFFAAFFATFFTAFFATFFFAGIIYPPFLTARRAGI
jgi:hypothetical protein